jgi:RNA polymerase sigma-70 factor (ECF subfamily)
VGHHPSQPPSVAVPPGTDSDVALVAAAVAGDRQAFAVLVERHQVRILALLERLTGCREQARDLAQETFVSAYRKLATFEHRSAFSTWLHRIACNHAAAAGRRHRPTVSLDAPPAAGRPPIAPVANVADVSVRLEQEELAGHVRAVLGRLEARYREVVVLADMQGASYEEIAETLDIPLGTVRSRLHRARLELRRLLEPADRGVR